MGKNNLEAMALEEEMAMPTEDQAVKEDLTKTFNINKGQPLPDDLENPPVGEDGHFCLDQAGHYQPSWVQLIIFKAFDRQADPQAFPLGVPYTVPLDTWCDVPPGILESLKSAVETHHEFYAESPELVPGQVNFGGTKAVKKVKERPRFMYQFKASK